MDSLMALLGQRWVDVLRRLEIMLIGDGQLKRRLQ
jgi:hypothetical protein